MLIEPPVACVADHSIIAGRTLLLRLWPLILRATKAAIKLAGLAFNIVIFVAALDQVFPAATRVIWVYAINSAAAMRGHRLPVI